MNPQTTCKYCFHTVNQMDYFCPFCGKKIREIPLVTTSLKQISIYLISVLLPPAGLWPAIKYMRSSDPKAKRIGYIALVLTIVSLVISTWLLVGFIDEFNRQLTTQMNSGLEGFY